MPTEKFDVNLTLKAQRQGEKAFAETDAGLKLVKDSVRRFSEAEANGYVTSRAYKEVLKDLRTNALEAGMAFEAEAQFVRDTTRAIDRFREAEAAGLPVDEAMIAATVEHAAAEEAQAAATDAASESAAGGIPAWIGWSVAIIAATLVVWPFIAAIGSATVAIIGFVVAGTGALLLLAGMALAFGAVGVAVLALSSWTNQWQTQIGRLENRFKAVAQVLEKGTGPLLKQMVDFLIKMAPLVQSVGLALEGWFGSRLTGVLTSIGNIIQDLTPTFNAFGTQIAAVFDQGGPVIAQFFEIMTRGGLSAIVGLTQNLIRLANWFNKESPKWQPIWDAIGRAVQWVASMWQRLNDWVVANWPATMAQVQQMLDHFREGWDKWGPQIMEITGLLMQFVTVGLQAIIDHSEVLVPILLGVLAAFVLLIAIVAILAGAFVTAADAVMNFLSNTDNQFKKWANGVIGMVNAVIDAMNQIPGVAIGRVPYISYGGAGGPSTSDRGTGTIRRDSGGVYRERPTGTRFAHSGGNVAADEVMIVGGPGAEEIFIPNTSGRVAPAAFASSGDGASLDTSTMERILQLIENHLAAIRNESPAISATAMVRRSA